MEIHLLNVSRRFNREWIFKNLSYTFELNQSYAILGINGSGKSTLLQIVSGALSPSSGTIRFLNSNKSELNIDFIYQNVSIAAPYLELIEEFSLAELLKFHFSFKKRKFDTSDNDIINILGMASSKDKLIKYFSSGMKQRVKLALAFCSNSEILLLDEPTTNLDVHGMKWYLDLVENFLSDRITIVASNQIDEYKFTNHQILIADYK